MRKSIAALLFAAVLLPTLLLSVGVKDLTVSAETRVLAGPNNPVRLDLERFEQRFAQNNNLLFVVALNDKSIFTDEGLRAVDAITTRAWELPYASRVDSITNFPLIQSEDDSFGALSLADRGLPDTEEGFAAAERRGNRQPQQRLLAHHHASA